MVPDLPAADIGKGPETSEEPGPVRVDGHHRAVVPLESEARPGITGNPSAFFRARSRYRAARALNTAVAARGAIGSTTLFVRGSQ